MIAGCGPIGLATLLLADVSGAYPIVVSDISDERLEFAKTLVPSVMTYKNDTSISPKRMLKISGKCLELLNMSCLLLF